jgi:hypothetical protein
VAEQPRLENPEKDASDWVTGHEPMIGDAPDDITKARASELIDELRQQTGRGVD